MEASAGEKVEEFVVLHQEPSPSEAISPRVARPYIQALHSITLDGTEKLQEEEEEEEEEEQSKEKQEASGLKEEALEESQLKEEPAQIEELNAVMNQVKGQACVIMFVFLFSLILLTVVPVLSSPRSRGTPSTTWSTFKSATTRASSRYVTGDGSHPLSSSKAGN